MAAQLEPDEQRALDALFVPKPAQEPAASVEQRDFRRPRRFAPADLERLSAAFNEGLESLGLELSSLLHGAKVNLALSGLVETSAEELENGSDNALLVLRFDAGKEPAWVAWQKRSGLDAAERILGSVLPVSTDKEQPSTPALRELSRVERRLVQTLIEAVARGALAPRKLPASNPRLARTPEDLGSWREAGPGADPWRLRLDLNFELVGGAGGASTFFVFLPASALPGAVAAREAAKASKGPRPAPAHINAVALELRAYLGSNELTFQELMRLEPGDVIPLAAPLGSPLRVTVEGRPCAHATLGIHEGHLALKILDLTSEATDQD